jgi:indole-3-glycerol phosphate synthase
VQGTRRFSQAISEGDGISVIVEVADPEDARRAEEEGAEALAIRRLLPGVRDATTLSILWYAQGPPEEASRAGADACLISADRSDDGRLERLHERALELGLDCVVRVRDEEELELALELVDPEILLLSANDGDEEDDALERALDLLADVPAGKLAIAELADSSRETVVALERAGVDAVIVPPGNVAELVGGAPPEV